MRSVRSIERRALRGCSADSADERFAGIGSRTYDLTFSEEKPLGTSPYAWRYTGVEGSGWGFFFANRQSQASANYQTSVKEGTATLMGLKTYGEMLIETNDYAIGSPSLPRNAIFADWAVARPRDDNRNAIPRAVPVNAQPPA